MKVAVIGSTGFVGGYLVDALLAAGHEVSALVRSGSEDKLRTAGQCRVTIGDLADKGALRATLDGCDAVLYNVGLLREYPARGITFEEAHYQGVRRVAEIAQSVAIKRFVLMSANGVKVPGTSYQETKFRAERLIAEMGFDVTVFRPSVIFGDPRGAMEIATQLYEDLVRPPVPAPAFHTGLRPSSGPVKMSPVHAADVADAFVASLDKPDAVGKTLVLGGPEELTWSDMLQRVAAATGKRKRVLPVPIGLMKVGATFLDWLPAFPVTRDQLIMLAEGNTAPPNELESLIGRKPRAFSQENLAYLRP